MGWNNTDLEYNKERHNKDSKLKMYVSKKCSNEQNNSLLKQINAIKWQARQYQNFKYQ
jgi:hypothetical protein